jgi:fibronectin-binding autotransporter adhesin
MNQTLPRPRFAAARSGIVALVGLVTLVASAAHGQGDLTVTSGSQATAASESFGSVSVSGTSPLGVRSTLTVTGPISITSGLQVYENGLVTAQADVGLGTSDAYVYDGGTLDLVSGTFAANALYLTGTGSFGRTGGVYALNTLGLSGEAAATVAAGDQFVVAGGLGPTVLLASGATLTLGANLGGPGNEVDLSITGSTSGLARTSQTYALNALGLDDGATLTFGAGDSILSFAGVSGGATLTLTTNLSFADPDGQLLLSGSGSTLARSSQTIDVGYLSVVVGANLALQAGDAFDGLSVGAGSTVTLPSTAVLPTLQVADLSLGGTIAGLDERPYDVARLTLEGTSLTLRSGTIDDAVSEGVSLNDGGTLSLQKNLVLAGPGSYLSINGTASGIDRGGNSVTVGGVGVSNGASFTVEAGDTVTESLGVFSYGDATTLTLGRSVVLSGTGVGRGVFLLGPGATIDRSDPSYTITGSGAAVEVSDSAAFEIRSGDSFPDAAVSVSAGGQLSNSGSQSVATLAVQNAGSRYQASAPLAVTSTSGSALSVSDAAAFAVASQVNVTDAVFASAVLELLSGTFTAGTLTMSGSGGFVRDPGAAYAVGALTLNSQASMTFKSVDSIESLVLDGLAGLTAQSALGLTSLSISGGSVLSLTAFNGAGLDGYAWALRLPGDEQSALAALFASGAITATGDWQIVYDDSGEQTFTYVTIAVPEPSTLVLAACGLALAGRLRRKRDDSTHTLREARR